MKNDYILIYRTRLGRSLPPWVRFGARRVGLSACCLLFVAAVHLLTSGASQMPLADFISQDSPLPEQTPVPQQAAEEAAGGCELATTPADHDLQRPAIKEIEALIDRDFFYCPTPPEKLVKAADNGEVTVCLTLDAQLQKHLISTFKKYNPMIAAGVVLDASSGAVLAMANYCRSAQARQLLPDEVSNYCVYSGFPAASLIKVITAAAVVEKKGFSCSEELPISGRYHTLYRSQLNLQEKKRRHTMNMSLEDAFARSVNPFFGKLGIGYLSDDEFAGMARDFLFDSQIEFDLPVSQSSIFRPSNDFERAELASGYNTRTTISPLHAALIGALPLTNGRILRPYLVERVIGAEGLEMYHAQRKVLAQPINQQSVSQLAEMMQATVDEGTGRRSFARLRRLREFGKWSVGGKTGAMNLPENEHRCEWFAGFAESDAQKLAMAVVIVHGQNRSVRPGFVAAEIISSRIKDPSLKTAAAKPPAKQRSRKGRARAVTG